jgi:hypothetical protein
MENYLDLSEVNWLRKWMNLFAVILKAFLNIVDVILWSQSHDVGNISQIGRYRNSAAQEEATQEKCLFGSMISHGHANNSDFRLEKFTAATWKPITYRKVKLLLHLFQPNTKLREQYFVCIIYTYFFHWVLGCLYYLKLIYRKSSPVFIHVSYVAIMLFRTNFLCRDINIKVSYLALLSHHSDGLHNFSVKYLK